MRQTNIPDADAAAETPLPFGVYRGEQPKPKSDNQPEPKPQPEPPVQSDKS